MQDPTLLGDVTTRLEDGVAHIEFSHPAHNSLPGRLLAKLTAAINEAGENAAARVVVLRSGGERTFCAGASFDELSAIDDLAAGRHFFQGFANVINAIRRCPKFVLGRVQGKTIGGGVGLAAATDYCLATEHASIKLSELAIGIGPFVVGPAVARKVGQAAFQELAIDATNWRDAAWALRKGLYAEVFTGVELMDERLRSLAGQLAQSSPEAMAHLKRVFWEGAEYWDDLLDERAAISGKLVLTEFTKREIAKFKEK